MKEECEGSSAAAAAAAATAMRLSCLYCARMKRKCSGGDPCELCIRRRKTCTRSVRRKSGPMKGAKYAPRQNKRAPNGTRQQQKQKQIKDAGGVVEEEGEEEEEQEEQKGTGACAASETARNKNSSKKPSQRKHQRQEHDSDHYDLSNHSSSSNDVKPPTTKRRPGRTTTMTGRGGGTGSSNGSRIVTSSGSDGGKNVPSKKTPGDNSADQPSSFPRSGAVDKEGEITPERKDAATSKVAAVATGATRTPSVSLPPFKKRPAASMASSASAAAAAAAASCSDSSDDTSSEGPKQQVCKKRRAGKMSSYPTGIGGGGNSPNSQNENLSAVENSRSSSAGGDRRESDSAPFVVVSLESASKRSESAIVYSNGHSPRGRAQQRGGSERGGRESRSPSLARQGGHHPSPADHRASGNIHYSTAPSTGALSWEETRDGDSREFSPPWPAHKRKMSISPSSFSAAAAARRYHHSDARALYPTTNGNTQGTGPTMLPEGGEARGWWVAAPSGDRTILAPPPSGTAACSDRDFPASAIKRERPLDLSARQRWGGREQEYDERGDRRGSVDCAESGRGWWREESEACGGGGGGRESPPGSNAGRMWKPAARVGRANDYLLPPMRMPDGPGRFELEPPIVSQLSPSQTPCGLPTPLLPPKELLRMLRPKDYDAINAMLNCSRGNRGAHPPMQTLLHQAGELGGLQRRKGEARRHHDHFCGQLSTSSQRIDCNSSKEYGAKASWSGMPGGGDNVLVSQSALTLHPPSGLYRYNNEDVAQQGGEVGGNEYHQRRDGCQNMDKEDDRQRRLFLHNTPFPQTTSGCYFDQRKDKFVASISARDGEFSTACNNTAGISPMQHALEEKIAHKVMDPGAATALTRRLVVGNSNTGGSGGGGDQRAWDPREGTFKRGGMPTQHQQYCRPRSHNAVGLLARAGWEEKNRQAARCEGSKDDTAVRGRSSGAYPRTSNNVVQGDNFAAAAGHQRFTKEGNSSSTPSSEHEYERAYHQNHRAGLRSGGGSGGVSTAANGDGKHALTPAGRDGTAGGPKEAGRSGSAAGSSESCPSPLMVTRVLPPREGIDPVATSAAGERPFQQELVKASRTGGSGGCSGGSDSGRSSSCSWGDKKIDAGGSICREKTFVPTGPVADTASDGSKREAISSSPEKNVGETKHPTAAISVSVSISTSTSAACDRNRVLKMEEETLRNKRSIVRNSWEENNSPKGYIQQQRSAKSDADYQSIPSAEAVDDPTRDCSAPMMVDGRSDVGGGGGGEQEKHADVHHRGMVTVRPHVAGGSAYDHQEDWDQKYGAGGGGGGGGGGATVNSPSDGFAHQRFREVESSVAHRVSITTKVSSISNAESSNGHQQWPYRDSSGETQVDTSSSSRHERDVDEVSCAGEQTQIQSRYYHHRNNSHPKLLEAAPERNELRFPQQPVAGPGSGPDRDGSGPVERYHRQPSADGRVLHSGHDSRILPAKIEVLPVRRSTPGATGQQRGEQQQHAGTAGAGDASRSDGKGTMPSLSWAMRGGKSNNGVPCADVSPSLMLLGSDDGAGGGRGRDTEPVAVRGRHGGSEGGVGGPVMGANKTPSWAYVQAGAQEESGGWVEGRLGETTVRHSELVALARVGRKLRHSHTLAAGALAEVQHRAGGNPNCSRLRHGKSGSHIGGA